MSKRRLTEQQNRRIAAKVQSDQDEAGLVIANLGNKIEVELADGKCMPCFVRQNLPNIVPGDHINLQDDVITSVNPRDNILQRPDKYKQVKTIAANIDKLLITIATTPKPIDYYLDQYLVIAELENITPVILLNKSDLVITKSITKLLDRYRQLDYQIINISATEQNGLEPLVDIMKNQTSIFVGQSGVGKSTLINAIMQTDIAKVGEISEANLQGRHTTTTARLYHLPFGGDLIDSPGIREFGLWHLPAQQILQGFKELYELSLQCKFRNCDHVDTKGCAILTAQEAGTINKERLKSYYYLLEQVNNVQ